MTSLTKRLVPLAALALAVCGCSKPAPPPAAGSEEEAVQKAFTALQEAMKAKDGEKLFALLDSDSQADAERAAQALKDAYSKAPPAEKTEKEKALGLSAAELSALDAKGFLKSKQFLGYKNYHEIPTSKFEKATVQGDKATLNYIEDDGDHEKLSYVKQGGAWKLSIPIPK
jgi:hypothetical protein